MSEEQVKKQEQLEQQQEVVDEAKKDEAVQDEPQQDVQDVGEAPADEKKDTQTKETGEKVSEDIPTKETPEIEQDSKEDTKDVEEPEVKPDEVSEPSEAVTEVEKKVNQEQQEAPARDEELERAKAELAEKEAELAEEKAIKSYEDDVREANRQYDEFLTNLGNAMLQELNKYGIDANTSIEELRKTDPAKAQVAENIVRQAQQAKELAQRNVQNNLNDRLTDVVFGKASRLFDKYELTNEQGEVAAETFVNIMAQSGIRDMGDDLIAKVELAVARAKLLKPKVEKVIDDAKAVVKEAGEAVVDVINAKAPKKAETPEKTEEAPKEAPKEEEKKEETPKVESVIETPSIEEFKESAVTSTQQTGSPINEDNVLDEMAKLSYKDRVSFYAKNKTLVDKAMAKKANAERKRI